MLVGQTRVVFQESILPNRKLLFNGNEMVWECMQRRICECGHLDAKRESDQYAELKATLELGYKKGKPHISHEDQSDSMPLRVLQLKAMFLRDSSMDVQQEGWRAIVEDYSNRYLTNRTDKLAAVSGLAQMMMRAKGTPNTYLAGL